MESNGVSSRDVLLLETRRVFGPRHVPPNSSALCASYLLTGVTCQRAGRKAICVFLDGGVHDSPLQAASDQQKREALTDAGYRVIVLRGDEAWEQQLVRYAEVF